jgi:hypothetical protein
VNPGDLVLIEPASAAEVEFYRQYGLEANADNYDFAVEQFFRFDQQMRDCQYKAGKEHSRAYRSRSYWKNVAKQMDKVIKRKKPINKEYSRTGVLID